MREDPSQETAGEEAPIRALCVQYLRNNWNGVPETLLRICPQFQCDSGDKKPTLLVDTLLDDLKACCRSRGTNRALGRVGVSVGPFARVDV